MSLLYGQGDLELRLLVYDCGPALLWFCSVCPPAPCSLVVGVTLGTDHLCVLFNWATRLCVQSSLELRWTFAYFPGKNPSSWQVRQHFQEHRGTNKLHTGLILTVPLIEAPVTHVGLKSVSHAFSSWKELTPVDTGRLDVGLSWMCKFAHFSHRKENPNGTCLFHILWRKSS